MSEEIKLPPTNAFPVSDEERIIYRAGYRAGIRALGCGLLDYECAVGRIRELEAECEALRADAERYRWLRKESYIWGSYDHCVSDLSDLEGVTMWIKGSVPIDDAGINAAIDAARAKETK